MGQKITEVSQKIKQSMQDPSKKKSWQSGIGIGIFALFVLSSVIVNRSVQALNQAVGSYGYYGSLYGYGGSTGTGTVTTSDAPPAAPTAFSASSLTTTTATISWGAVTTTTATPVTNITSGQAMGVAAGSVRRYLINYGTGSVVSGSNCAATNGTTILGADTTAGSGATSQSLTGLTAGTTYNCAICTEDNNLNNSTALTCSFTTAAVTGGNAATGGGGGAPTGPTFPTATPTTTTTTAPTAVAVPTTTTTTSVTQSATEFGVTLSTSDTATAASFVANGTNAASVALGSGERLALVRDQLETLGRISVTALDQLANGQKPTVRNLTKERARVGSVRAAFRALLGRDPNFQNVKEDLAYNTLQYRVRFARDLNKERTGIAKFRATFKKLPRSPLDWATVRAWAYALR